MKKKIIIFAIVLTAGFMVFAVKEGVRLYRYKEKAKATKIEQVEITKTRDGVYKGEYDLDYVYVALSVTVKNAKISSIDILEHKNERGAEAERVIPKRIIDTQSVKVDAVSGATNSSKSIMKSVENALKNGSESHSKL